MTLMQVTVEGYGGRADSPGYQATLLEVTKSTIWLKSEFGKQPFRIRDGKKVGDSYYSGFKICDKDLERIPGRRHG